MSTSISPAGGPNDPRLGTADPATSQGARRRPDADGEHHGTEAAKVTISRQAVLASEAAGVARSQTGSAEPIEDLDQASELTTTLAAQISEDRGAAHAAQAHSNPKVALNLLI
jgi:hypothetical protein